MTLPKSYLKYKHRHRGMDHDLYDYSPLPGRPPVRWQDARHKVALWVTVSLEYFPLKPADTPFRAPGHMVTPYPDLRTYTARDYGNRVGIFRILEVFDRLGVKASFPTNSALTRRTPRLIEEVAGRGHEFIGHGVDMNALSYGGLDMAKEKRQIRKALKDLRAATGQSVRGWLSPARSESEHTLEILGENGIDYVCDWVNDDMPYPIKGGEHTLIAMPHSMELEDRRLLVELGQRESVWQSQIYSALETLRKEAAHQGGRILHIALTPYVIGQAWRIKTLFETLEVLMATPWVWNACGADILDIWKAQQ